MLLTAGRGTTLMEEAGRNSTPLKYSKPKNSYKYRFIVTAICVLVLLVAVIIALVVRIVKKIRKAKKAKHEK